VALVRGRSLVPLRAFVKETFGDHGWNRLLHELPPKSREVLDGLILPESWYDRAIDRDAVEMLFKLWRAEVPDLGRRLGSRVAKHHARFYLRPIFMIGGPMLVVRRTAAIYRDYYKGGSMSVIEQRDSGARLAIEDDMTHEWFCTETLPAFITELFALGGRRIVRLEQDVCRFRGAEHCELELEWV
jgi:hypothetical protein